MKIIDIIFALICGKVVGFVISDFLKEWGISITFYESIILWFLFPVLSLVCLWIADIIGRKILFIFQATKHLLAGAFATVVDLKLFEFLLTVILGNPLISKSVSFLASTSVKYLGNKYWVFEKKEKEDMQKEIIPFFVITLVGLMIDISTFYYATKVLGSQFLISSVVWVKISVIFAALVAALWNFLGYKFFVFKK